MRSSSTPAVACSGLVSSRCSPCCRLQAPDAPHHGRYVPTGQFFVLSQQWHLQAGFAGFTPRYVFPLVVGRPAARSASWPVWTNLCSWLVLLVTILLALYSPWLRAGPCCRASWTSWTGLFVARCATTRLTVQTVQIYVLEQFLDKVVTRPLRPWSLHRCISWTRLLSSRQCRGPDSENCLDFPQLPFIDGRRHPGHGAEAGSHGFPCSEDHRDSAVAVCFLVVDVPVCRSCRFFVAVCVKTVEIPQ